MTVDNARFAPFHRWDRNFFLFMVLIWLGILMGFVPQIIKHVQMHKPAYPPVVQLDAQTMAGYAGTYRAPGGNFVATVKDGHLFMQLGSEPSFEIYPSAKDEFYYKVVDAQITFHRDASGAIAGLTLHQSGADRNATKSP